MVEICGSCSCHAYLTLQQPLRFPVRLSLFPFTCIVSIKITVVSSNMVTVYFGTEKSKDEDAHLARYGIVNSKNELSGSSYYHCKSQYWIDTSTRGALQSCPWAHELAASNFSVANRMGAGVWLSKVEVRNVGLKGLY